MHLAGGVIAEEEQRPAAVSSISKTASTLAPILFRGPSPLDPDLRRSASAPRLNHDFEKYSTTGSLGATSASSISLHRPVSPFDRTAALAKEISRPSSTSTQDSSAAFFSGFRKRSIDSQTTQDTASVSLPGLSALASLAVAPPVQLRYASLAPFHGSGMRYRIADAPS